MRQLPSQWVTAKSRVLYMREMPAKHVWNSYRMLGRQLVKAYPELIWGFEPKTAASFRLEGQSDNFAKFLGLAREMRMRACFSYKCDDNWCPKYHLKSKRRKSLADDG